MGNRGATDLSGGQQQRVALARAIVARPKVLLFDEPLSNLDAKLREQMRYLIKDIQRETGITAVYVTHDQAEAMGLGDELIVMNRGRIEQRGDAHSMYLRPKNRFVAEFIGIANLLEATVLESAPSSGGALRLKLNDGDDPAIVTAIRGDDELGNEATVLIRPESIEIEARKPERAENVIGGKIRSVQYLGDRTEFVVQTVAREIRVTKIGRPSFEEGAEVHLTFDTEDALAISPPGDSEVGKDRRQ
jgi:iron(III) transport system ATP-binding protein